jgi:hypothetical protein
LSKKGVAGAPTRKRNASLLWTDGSINPMRLTAWKMAIAFVEQGFNFGAACSDDDIVALS